jgi:hypothetical protein
MGVNPVKKLLDTGKIKESGSPLLMFCGESCVDVQGELLFLIATS